MRRTRKRGLSPLAWGALLLAFVLVVVYFSFVKAVPFREHYEISAVFKSANNVTPKSPVRIAGVTIGTVRRVEFVRPGEQVAKVVMRIEKKGLPLHKDATFKVRPRIFLEGNFFVDASPGSPSAPELDDGDVVPVNQTSAPVQFDQILTSLQSSTRKDLQRLLQELSSGLEGEGARGFNRSIKFGEPAFKNSAIVNEATLGIAEHDLSEYIESAGKVAEGLDRSPEQLKSLITDFNTTARAFAVEESQLSSTLRELPRTLRAATPAFASLNAAFPPVRRLVAALRPGVRSSVPTIRAATPLVRQLRRLVSDGELRGLTRDLRPTVPALTRLNKATVPLLEEVRQASSCQNDVILPWTKDKIVDKQFPASGKVFEEFPKGLVGLAGESRSGDANGQWFRVAISAGQYATPMGMGRFALTGSPIMGANPPKPAGRPPLRSKVPCETQEQPDLRTTVDTSARSMKVDMTSGAAKALEARGLAEATTWLKGQLVREDLDGLLKVTKTPVTDAEIPKLRTLGKIR